MQNIRNVRSKRRRSLRPGGVALSWVAVLVLTLGCTSEKPRPETAKDKTAQKEVGQKETAAAQKKQSAENAPAQIAPDKKAPAQKTSTQKASTQKTSTQKAAPRRPLRKAIKQTAAAPPPHVDEKSVENLLSNGGFEDGRDPWWSFGNDNWVDFVLDDSKARSGSKSLHLSLIGKDTGQKHLVAGAIQEVECDRFPDHISGYYYVDQWNRASAKQYLQFVVIVFEDESRPGWTNHQIRYPLTGADEQPFNIANAKYIFIGTEEPVTGKWVRFQRDLASDFLDKWGRIPANFGAIRVYLEVRYDEAPEAGAKMAEVYFDDLTLGYRK